MKKKLQFLFFFLFTSFHMNVCLHGTKFEGVLAHILTALSIKHIFKIFVFNIHLRIMESWTGIYLKQVYCYYRLSIKNALHPHCACSQVHPLTFVNKKITA